MTADEVRQIAAWLEATQISQLELTAPGRRLRLTLGGAAPSADPLPKASSSPHVITAGGTGVFLDTHPWTGVALASPGEPVRAGDVVGLLRTGLLLQPVTAPQDGILGARLAVPGATVGFGTPLIEFAPAPAQERSTR
jgi:biotin carboxyl carrier protein